MTPTRLKMRGTPEAAGYGFVLGVVAGTLLGDSLTFVTLSALCGAVAVPALRRLAALGTIVYLWAGKIRAAGRPADVRPS